MSTLYPYDTKVIKAATVRAEHVNDEFASIEEAFESLEGARVDRTPRFTGGGGPFSISLAAAARARSRLGFDVSGDPALYYNINDGSFTSAANAGKLVGVNSAGTNLAYERKIGEQVVLSTTLSRFTTSAALTFGGAAGVINDDEYQWRITARGTSKYGMYVSVLNPYPPIPPHTSDRSFRHRVSDAGITTEHEQVSFGWFVWTGGFASGVESDFIVEAYISRLRMGSSGFQTLVPGDRFAITSIAIVRDSTGYSAQRNHWHTQLQEDLRHTTRFRIHSSSDSGNAGDSVKVTVARHIVST